MTVAARTVIAVLAAVGFATLAEAQSQGPSNPFTVANDASIGTVPWVSPNQALTSDDVYAFAGIGIAAPSQYLAASNFGFTVPASAIILGIEVGVEKKVASGAATDNAVRIVKGGTIGATDRSDINPWPGTDTVVVYGGSTDLWGETWTAADINGAGFGAAISAKDSISGALVQVDTFEITVFYALCGDTIVNSPTEDCDDGNTTPGDCCSSTCQFEASGSSCQDDGDPCTGVEECDGSGACLSEVGPPAGCRTSLKGLLLYKDNATNDAKDKLVFKWIKGQSTTFAELGLPTGTTAYTLCLYAGTAALGDATIAGGSGFWKVLGANKGYKYKDKPGSSDGITKVILKASTSNKAKALVKGKGLNLPDLVTPFATPVTAQLHNDDNNVCFTTTLSTVKKNVAGQFKGKAP